MIEPICDSCGEKLNDPGGLFFTAPMGDIVRKRHLCESCTDIMDKLILWGLGTKKHNHMNDVLGQLWVVFAKLKPHYQDLGKTLRKMVDEYDRLNIPGGIAADKMQGDGDPHGHGGQYV